MIKRIHSTLFQVKSLNRTADFYENLGFDVQKSDDAIRIIFGDYRFAFIDEKKAGEMDSSIPKGVGIFVYFEVEDIDRFFEAVKKNDIKTTGEPVKQPWGKKELTIIDPDGYKLVFFENV